MEERQVLHGHSWQSMKERFRSSIVGNLDFFDFLTKEEKRELRKHKARHVPTAPLDSTAASTALTTSALASALAPAFPSSMRSMLTHTPTPAVSVREPQDELLADLPDPFLFLLEVNGPESDVVPIYPHHLQGGQGCAVEVAPTF